VLAAHRSYRGARRVSLLDHSHLLGRRLSPTVLGGDDDLHLGRTVSHRHRQTPTSYGSGKPCPGIKGRLMLPPSVGRRNSGV
jgi:hypothetical protein